MASTVRTRAVALVVAGLAVLGAAAPAPAAAEAAFEVQGSLEAVASWGHVEGTPVELLAPGGTVLQAEPADAQGAVLFDDVAPGAGYAVRAGGETSAPVAVLDPEAHPDPSTYEDIDVGPGYGYIPTRDGTLLSANVAFPPGAGAGPWPVLVVYSGYDPSNPAGLPTEVLPFLLRGYAVVGINMRGSGCSGGAFDYQAAPSGTDGYDAIEVLARQDWSNGRVGMVGISYSAISQLYVAATRPPSLEAITPVSAYGDAYSGILYPGGIRNEGFALEWALDRQAAARPAARAWARDRIAAGDEVCAENQRLRLQSQDLQAEISPERYASEEYAYLDITRVAERIEVPTYLGAQFQDEQTGGSAVHLARVLQESGTPFRAVFSNGTHVEPMGPTELPRIAEFIDLHVGLQVPDFDGVNPILPAALGGIFDPPILTVPDRFEGMTFEEARAAYDAEDPIRVRYEVGGVEGLEGSPYATAEATYDAWPVPGTTAERWYLQPDGGLAPSPAPVPDDEPRATSSYRYDPDEGRPSTFDGSTEAMWKRHPDVHWESPSERTHLTFTTPAATTTRAYAGTGSVDLWLRSTAADTDLEAVITEVRPDGREVYVQSGWLRASHRTLDEGRSTVLHPVPTHLEGDASPLPAGQLTAVRLALFPFAHVVRPGSRLRLSIEAPGGNQPFWEYTTLDGPATNEIGHSVGRPSSVVLPLLPADDLVDRLPAAAPSCAVEGVAVQAQSLRGQPCRADRAPRTATDVAAQPGPGPGELTVRWSPPAPWDDEVQPSGYDVVVSPGDVTTTAGPGATEAVVTGVPTGVPVSAVVVPRHGGEPGAPSSPSLEVALLGPDEAFVTAAYTDLLGRPPSRGEQQAATAALAAGSTTRRALVGDLARSDEWLAAVVDSLYLDLLGRRADAAGLAHWVGRLRGGSLTVDRVAAALLGSAEHLAGPGGGTTATWVDEVYRSLLGRPVDPAGLTYWEAEVALQGRTRVALRLLRSGESARARVTALYGFLLGRAPDPAGLTFWAPRLVASGDVALAVELASSAEYAARAVRRFP